MSEGVGMMVLVVRLYSVQGLAQVNVYRDGAEAPALEKIELPFKAFPREPQVGEQFTLVIG